MDPQDQENFDESSTMDEQYDVDQAVNHQDSIKPDEGAGSVTSNRKVILKIKNYRVTEESVVEQPPPPPAAEIFRAEEIKSHRCKECNKSFSSGKALGGHMSSAHVQANKDYSYKKQKPKTLVKKPGYYSGSGPEDHICNECGKCFPSQKSLYGHMRCHPDRDYRGMVEPRMESSQASTELGFDYMGLDQDEDDGVDYVPHAASVDSVNSLKAWAVKAKRGRSAMTGTVSPPIPKTRSSSSSEKEKEIAAGHQLLRLLGRTRDSGVKIGGVGEVYPVGPVLDNGVNSKKQGTESPVEKPIILSGVEADNRHELEKWNWDEPRNCKRPRANNNRSPKMKIWNTNGKIEEDNVGKGKDKIVEDGLESEYEDDLLLGAVSVLAHGKRKHYCCQPYSPRPVPENNFSSHAEKLLSSAMLQKDGLGPKLNTGKHICCTCSKVFSSPQALGGHRSSHKKVLVNIINSADDDYNGNDTKAKTTKNVVSGGVKINGDDDLHVCKICGKVFATARALGGHKKCHNNNNNKSGIIIDDGNQKDNIDNNGDGGGKEKVARGFDLNMPPDDDNGAADS